ncbi:MAG: hypothetical protein FWE33_00920 [Defluviitaleaceae bacterium]|nr:hypothetical protein [Defluviitaleaceae bacterium]
MKIVITAGGTIEKIDAVRSIINNSTGQLGAEIAEAFFTKDCEIIYIRGKNAVSPNLNGVKEIIISSAADLDIALAKVFAKGDICAIIHAMAVSDYRVKGKNVGKISSDNDEITLILEKIPKTIGKLRTLAPNAIIVGFKLTSGLSQEETLGKAKALMTKNNCDFVLANDTSNLTPNGHLGYLVAKNGSFNIYEGKQNIAQAIVKEVLKLC